MSFVTIDVIDDVFASEQQCSRIAKITEDAKSAQGTARRPIRNLSAIAGALASSAAWFVGTLAIFAFQDTATAGAAVPFLLA